MINDTMVLGVIPARGGSKGIPGKNIRNVLGKPLIAYSIQCGLKCPSIDHLIVTTDSRQIADIALQWGADVPFMRPHELAGDLVPMLPVLHHAVTAAEKHYGKMISALVLLDATGPLRTVDDVENCLKLFRNSDCEAVVSGNVARRSPYFNMVIQKNRYIQLAIPTPMPIGRRQDSPPVYDLNTVVWVYSRKAIIEEKSRIPERTLLYLVPPDRALDIDTELDLKILEVMFGQMTISQDET